MSTEGSMELVVVTARVLLGVVFAVSAVEKVTDSRPVRRFLANTMRHGWMVVPSVVGTVVVEAGAVSLLLLPVAAGWSVRAGFVLILGLLGIFTVIVALAVRRRV